ncbi:MAG TPA: FtsX-like permease family protein, partial [Aeromicrobium sp.]|nr:FtsX-like permease family protein [Aeromicrobium sp.]
LVPALGKTGPGQTLEIRVDADYDANLKESIHSVSVVTADLGMGSVPSGRQPMLANIVVSPETAEDFALPLSASAVLISGTISDVQEKALKTIIKGDGSSVLDFSSRLDVERGYQSDAPFILLLLAIIGGAAVLIGTLSATGLALNDARPDFATLNAIGAAPVTRRVMAAAQALTIGGIGVGLGLIIGFLPGVLSARSLTDYGTGSGSTLDLPWMLFGILAIVVPLLAALVSGLFIRNNNVAVRRVAG